MNEELEQLTYLIDNGTYALQCDNSLIYWKYIRDFVLPYLRDRRRVIWKRKKPLRADTREGAINE